MSVKVTGVKNFRSEMRKLGSGFDEAVDQGVFVTAQEVRDHAIKSIMNQSSGKQVKRSRQGGGTYTHTAAAKGQAPNNDTGKLVESMAVEKAGNGFYVVGAGGGSVKYASALEFGTKKMGARPFMHPALKARGGGLIANISEVVQIYINRLNK